MGGKRQKNQLQLSLGLDCEPAGVKPDGEHQGTEPSTTGHNTESQVRSAGLMEAIVGEVNVELALQRVRANKGAPGVDGMTVARLPKYLRKHWSELRGQLLDGSYRPQPVLRVWIDKPDGGKRKLGIPTVLDRFVQQLLLQVLQRQWDPTFSEHSYGFRPHRSAHQAVEQAQEYIDAGCAWVVDMDLEKFFDRVNHDVLMSRVARRVEDKRVLKLIRAFLNAGVMEDGLVSPNDEGTPQGGPLSPLLSNLLLDELDRELEQRGLRFVRYADDCNIYVGSRRAGERVMGSITRFLQRKLKLKVNADKSAVDEPQKRKFLGFSFTRGSQPKRRLAPQTKKRFKRRVREMTSRSRGRSLEQVVKQLRGYLIGWLGYFGFCQLPGDLKELEGWMRRRLRCLVWHQWKRSSRRRAELIARGVAAHTAARIAGSSYGDWHLSRTYPVQAALPNDYFISLGLPPLRCAEVS